MTGLLFYMYTLRTARPWEYWYAGLRTGEALSKNISLSSRVQLGGKKPNKSNTTDAFIRIKCWNDLTSESLVSLNDFYKSCNKRADILAIRQFGISQSEFVAAWTRAVQLGFSNRRCLIKTLSFYLPAVCVCVWERERERERERAWQRDRHSL